MWIWIVVLLAMMISGLAGAAYVVKRTARFGFIRNHFSKKQGYMISTVIIAAVIVPVFIWGGMWNTMAVFIHVLVIWLICDGMSDIICRVRKKPFERYLAGTAAVILSILCIASGVFFAHHVYATEYSIDTGRNEAFKIVGFSDSHVGTTFHGEKLNEYVRMINAEKPDIVVIAGDFVDDSTSYEDMLSACHALSGLETKYGVYFVYGNHDGGYYSARGYDMAELAENLSANGVIILEDEYVSITDDIVLCGRQDASSRYRTGMEVLTENIPEESYLIVLDHQPNDYAAEAAAGADLVISGHTHGGQFFPINRAGEWLGMNDMTYGHAKEDNTDFIVSSGIANWAFKMKTGCLAEYFVIIV